MTASKLRKLFEKKAPQPHWRGSFPSAWQMPLQPKILIIHTAFIGDVILITPVISGLKNWFPNAIIHALVIPQTEFLLKGNPQIDQLWVFDKRDKKKKWQHLSALAANLKKEKFDIIISPHRSATTALLVRLASPSLSIGFDRKWYARFIFHIRVHFQRGIVHHQDQVHPVHEIERHLSLLQPLEKAASTTQKRLLTIDDLSWQTSLFPDKEHAANALQLLSSQKGFSPRKQFIVVAPGSVWATKRWPAEYFAELVKELALKLKRQVVLIGGKEDQELCLRIAANTPTSVLNLAGKSNLLESAVVIQRAALLISNDSGPLHIANAMGTKVIAIFGATSPLFGFYPYQPGDVILEGREVCQPCRAHGSDICPLGHFHCMRNILPKQVLAAALSALGKENRSNNE